MGLNASASSGSASGSAFASGYSIEQFSKGKIGYSDKDKKSSKSENLKDIFFCEQGATHALGAVNHGFLVIKTDKNQYYRFEIGGSSDNVEISIENTNMSAVQGYKLIAKKVLRNKTLQDVKDFSLRKWKGQIYNVVKNNCYDYCQSILNAFTQTSENSDVVEDKKHSSIALGVTHITGLAVGATAGMYIGMVGGPLGAAGGAVIGGLSQLLTVRATKAIFKQ